MSRAHDAKSLVQQALDEGLVTQQASARENVERLRRINTSDTPRELTRRLNRAYLHRRLVSGGVSGARAAVPDGRTRPGSADVMAFAEASVHYLLSRAEIHGVHPEDIERRELLVSTALLGSKAVRGLDKVVEHAGPYLGTATVRAIPTEAINRANNVLGPRFITKYGTKRGVLVLNEQVPPAMGAALGICGQYALGWLTIKSADQILGHHPSSWADDDSDDEVPFGPGSGDGTR